MLKTSKVTKRIGTNEYYVQFNVILSGNQASKCDERKTFPYNEYGEYSYVY